MSADNGIIEGALALARLGLRVHPLRGKQDAATGTRERASCDAAAVRALFAAHRDATNVGVVPGPNFIGVDIDVRHAGWERLAIIEDEAAATLDLETTSWETGGAPDDLGRRGRHLIYRVSTPIRGFTLAPGVEIKGVGGNLVAPPSRHPETGDPYRLLVGGEPADAPDWLLELVPEERPASEPGERRSTVIDSVYGIAALHGEQARIAAMPIGGDGRTDGRNTQLRNSTYSLGRLVAGGELRYDTAHDGITSAAVDAGYRRDPAGGLYRKHRVTIISGLAAGMKTPRNAPERGTNGTDNTTPPAEEPAAGPRVLRMSEVAIERVEWLWSRRIPKGKVAVIDGLPGLGKSTMTCDITARLSRGLPLPGDLVGRPPAGVVMLSAEDGTGDTIRPRLEAAGADLTRVVQIDEVPGVGSMRPPIIPDDLPTIERTIVAESAELLIVDPLMAFLGAEVDAIKDQDVRRALHLVMRMAERACCAVLVVRHPTKAA